MSTETPYNPYAAFENMADEDVVLKAEQEDNALAREYLLHKHIPLNSYVSLNKPIYEEDSDRTLLDIISGVKVANPEDMIISREEFADIENKMNNILSDLEWKVLMSYLDGKSYQEIAVELDRHIKSIDNALQRVKRKLEKYITNRNDNTDLSEVYSGLLAIDSSERFSHRKRD